MNIALNGMQSIQFNWTLILALAMLMHSHCIDWCIDYIMLYFLWWKNLILALDLPSFRASHTQLVMVYGVTGLRQWNAVAWQLWLFVVSYLVIYKLYTFLLGIINVFFNTQNYAFLIAKNLLLHQIKLFPKIIFQYTKLAFQ